MLRSLRAAHEARELGRRSLLAGEARKKVEAVMEENDVFFNGAREERTQQSALGIAQAYSVHHLVPAMRGKNETTLSLIAAILNEYPDLFCEVKGTTSGQGKREADPNLAKHFRLDATRDYKKIMDRLAEERALACRKEVRMTPHRFPSHRACSSRLLLTPPLLPSAHSPRRRRDPTARRLIRRMHRRAEGRFHPSCDEDETAEARRGRRRRRLRRRR